MATKQRSAKLTAADLTAAVERLSAAELRKFTRWLAKWQKQNGKQSEEGALLTCIEENARLPPVQHRRFKHLRRKCDRKTLTDDELAEYQSLLQQLEARNVKRVKALIALARRRGTTPRDVMAELGLKGGGDVG